MRELNRFRSVLFTCKQHTDTRRYAPDFAGVKFYLSERSGKLSYLLRDDRFENVGDLRVEMTETIAGHAREKLLANCTLLDWEGIANARAVAEKEQNKLTCNN